MDGGGPYGCRLGLVFGDDEGTFDNLLVDYVLKSWPYGHHASINLESILIERYICQITSIILYTSILLYSV